MGMASGTLQKTTTPILPVKEYVSSNFKSIDSSAFAKLHSKFENTGESTPQAAVKLSKVEPVLGTPMQWKPSVGTWLGPLPKYIGGKTVESPSQLTGTTTSEANFTLKPS